MTSLRRRVAGLVSLLVLSVTGIPIARAQDARLCDSHTAPPEAAIAACTRGIQSGRARNMAALFHNRGNHYFRKQDYQNAISDFGEAIAIDPRYEGAYVSRGGALESQGNLDAALADLQRAIELNPRNPRSYNNRAIVYSRKGDYERAVIDIDQAIRLEPNDPVRYNNRGFMQRRLGRIEPAIADFDQAIRMSPRYAQAFGNRGNAWFDKGDNDRAIADYTAAIQIDPRLVAPIKNRANAYFKKEEYDRAIADYELALRLAPNDAETFANRCHVYGKKQEYDRAIADCTTAISADPGLLLGYFNRGTAHQDKGDISRARDDFSIVLSRPKRGPEDDSLRQIAQEKIAALTSAATKSVAGPSTVAAAPAAIAPPAAKLPDTRRKVALVIGNSAYKHAAPLPNPTNDARDLAAALRKLGFDVVEGRDLDRPGMDNSIRQFSRKLDGADLAVFFYAGHGMQVAGKNYLVPIDAKLERPGDLNFDTVDVALVLAQMESENRVNLIFLDACRDNPLARSLSRSMGTRSSSVGNGLAQIQSAIGTMIAYATQPDNVALDGDGKNSPFTAALLKHIVTPGLDIGTVMRRVRTDVIAATKQKQVPWDHSSLTADVILAR
jgi:tetratricopeptide (TPR) repeat protein